MISGVSSSRRLCRVIGGGIGRSRLRRWDEEEKWACASEREGRILPWEARFKGLRSKTPWTIRHSVLESGRECERDLDMSGREEVRFSDSSLLQKAAGCGCGCDSSAS